MKNAAKNLELIDLSKTFITSTRGEVKAVQKVNIKIEQGEFVTLLGPSGCGKTTLLRMIAGFELPTSGQILIGGNDVSSKNSRQERYWYGFSKLCPIPSLKCI